MTTEFRRLETSPRRPLARPGSNPVSFTVTSLIQDLECLRARVLERLSSIETLARERPAAGGAALDVAALEGALKEQYEELEETRRRVRDQAERERQNWSAARAQLEEDRRLLAEAWERVENERVESQKPAHEKPVRESQALTCHPGGSSDLSHNSATIPIRSAATGSDPYNPVAQAILRQFQTLCSDVRQNAQGRRAAR
jgi:hypothetical protein